MKEQEFLFVEMQKTYDSFVMVGKHGDRTAVGVKGKPVDLLNLTRELVCQLREEMGKHLGEDITDILLKTLVMTDEELDEAIREQKADIPEWLKKLMHRDDEEEEEDDDEDGEDVQDDTESDSEEESYREAFNKLVDALRNCGRP